MRQARTGLYEVLAQIVAVTRVRQTNPDGQRAARSFSPAPACPETTHSGLPAVGLHASTDDVQLLPMLREAACQCGQLVLRCIGEPAGISLCHCLDCQRRTGSVFGIAAFFAKEQVTIVEGSSTQFRRGSDSGSGVTFHFCGRCGSTVWWEAERLPLMMGVAVGAFADPDFPAPKQATWHSRQHRWLHLPDEIVSYPQSFVRTAPSE